MFAGQYLDRWVGEVKMVGLNIEESMSVIVEPSALVFDTMPMPSSWTVSSGHHSSIDALKSLILVKRVCVEMYFRGAHCAQG